MSARLCVAVFGLGEAGSVIAADLVAAGACVRGYDPAPVSMPDGVVRVEEPRRSVEGAELVLGITAGQDAEAALRQALHEIDGSALYADLSTSSPSQKRTLAAIANATGLDFADVALMSTVAGKGMRTPQLVAGAGAQRYVDLVVPLGARATVVGTEAGAAATHKLLRSVVMKGLAALTIEALRAGDACGQEEWLWEHLASALTAMDETMLRRLVEGTPAHALRRRHEMEAATELLAELGVAPVMTRATVETLARVGEDGVPPLPRKSS